LSPHLHILPISISVLLSPYLHIHPIFISVLLSPHLQVSHISISSSILLILSSISVLFSVLSLIFPPLILGDRLSTRLQCSLFPWLHPSTSRLQFFLLLLIHTPNVVLVSTAAELRVQDLGVMAELFLPKGGEGTPRTAILHKPERRLCSQ
jgi:hypothetical protein